MELIDAALVAIEALELRVNLKYTRMAKKKFVVDRGIKAFPPHMLSGIRSGKLPSQTKEKSL